MNIDLFRKKMWGLREAFDRDARASKESNLAWEWLINFYSNLDPEERKLGDQILMEWALSDDENVRCDALVVIGHFNILSATQTLQELATRLKDSKAPGAVYELQKVNSILRDMNAGR